MFTNYRTIELRRIVGSCRPIAITVYLVTNEEKSVQFTIYLSTEEFCEHVFKYIMTDEACTDIMFDRLIQLYRIRQKEMEEVVQKLIRSVFIIEDDDD